MAGFGATPTTTTEGALATNQIPISSVAVPGTANGDLTALEGGPATTDSNSNKTAPVSVYGKAGTFVDGSDATQGLTTDTAVQGDNSGTVSAKLRGLNKTLADVYDSSNHALKVEGVASGTAVIVSGTVNTLHGSAVDATNSSTATLTANSVFTGTSQSSLNYSAISIEIFSDQASAAGGLSVQQSTDGTNWDIKDTFSVVASTAFQTTVNLVGQNYRIVYTNGSVGQGTFRLQTVKQTSEAALPRTLTALGNLSTAVAEPLPAGTNNIGKVNMQIASASVATGGANNLLAVGGPVASGAANADNPLKVGGVFNTTQPTVTNSQIVDAQYTARGAAIVATGTDTFTVSGTVTANAGTNLNTSALALDTSVNGVLVAQASATSGEKGPLIQGAVTTAAPTYTTAQTNPLSLNTSGGLRVDGSGVTQPVSAASLPLPSGAATAAKQPALGTAGSASADVISVQGIASMTALKVDGSGVTQPVSGTVTANAGIGTQNVSQQASGSTSGTLQSAATTTGTGTVLSLLGNASCIFTVSGTYTGLTMAFQGSEDGSTYSNALSVTQLGTNTILTSISANGLYECSVAGLQKVQANISAIATGSVTVTAHAVPVTFTTRVNNVNQAGTWTVQPGNTANTTAWKVDNSAVTQPTNVTQINSHAVVEAANGIQKVGNSDSLGQAQYNFPAGFVRVSTEPSQLFYDPFDSTLDTTNRWNAAVSSGGGVAAAVSGGVMTIGTGTTASGYSHLSSQSSFTPTIPGWTGYSFAIKMADLAAPTANTYRFFGNGTVPGTPTTSAPLTDACGFELDTAGKMWAVIYNAGTRTAIQDLSSSSGNSKQPTDANYHRYIVYYRTDKIYFYIDALDTPVATANFTGPAVQTLPVRFLAVAASSAPGSSGVISCTGLAVWDTAHNNNTISDGTYGWRKAAVNSAGALSVNHAQVAGTTTSVNSGTTDAGTQRVVLASDQTPKTTATATRTNVAAAASDTSLLASNTSRKGALFFNDSTAILYLAYGSGAASTSSYSVQVPANSYFELPPEPIYTGAIRGIWSAANGNVRITENS